MTKTRNYNKTRPEDPVNGWRSLPFEAMTEAEKAMIDLEAKRDPSRFLRTYGHHSHLKNYAKAVIRAEAVADEAPQPKARTTAAYDLFAGADD